MVPSARNGGLELLAKSVHFFRMAPFLKKSDPAAKRAALLARLPLAEAKLTELRAKAVAAAREGSVLDAEGAWKAEFELNALRAALIEIEREITEAAETARLAAEKTEREATAKALHAAATEFEAAFAPLPEALHVALASFEKWRHLLGNSGLPTLLENLAVEIPQAVAVFTAELHARAQRTLDGDAPASLPAPPQLTVITPEKAAPTIQVFSLQSLQWRDERGAPQVAGPFQIAALPAAKAKVALQRHWAVEPASPEAQQIIKGAQPHIFDPGKIHDLDLDPHAPKVINPLGKITAQPPIPGFTVIDRGPPQPARFVKGPAPRPGDPNDVL